MEKPSEPQEEEDEKLKKLELIAEGSYGKVYKYHDKIEKRIIACKERFFRNQQPLEETGIPQDVLREITILKKLDSPYIVKPLWTIIDNINKKYQIFFEYFDCDLRKYYKNTKLNEIQIKKIIYKILKGLKYLHSNRILHRDLKPNNILIKGDRVAIADFGLAREITVPLKNYSKKVGTPNYRAPELIKKNGLYCTGVDIWAVGCIAFELIIGRAIFSSGNDMELKKEQIEFLGTKGFEEVYEFFPGEFKEKGKVCEVLKYVSMDFGELVMGLLRPEEVRRLEAVEALGFKCFDDVRDC